MNRQQTKLLRARRTFLKSAGVTVATLPFLRALPGYTQATSTPKLILGFNGNGRIRHLWGADDSTGSLQMRQNLAPLQPYAENITILEGIRNFGAQEIGGTHEGGTMSLFTGAGGGLSTEAANTGFPSIDTMFMAAQTGTARKDSFYQQTVAERNSSENAGPNNRLAFDASGNRRDPYRSSWEAFDGYLDGAIIPSGGATDNAGPSNTDLARTKLFESLNAQLGSLESQLCGEDYYQMQAMRESVAQAASAMAMAVECEVPTLPERPNYEAWEPLWQPPSSTIDLSSTTDWYYLRGRLATDLLVMSLACGVTRAGVLQFDQAAGEGQAVGQPLSHHNTSHEVPQPTEFLVRYMGQAATDSSLPAQYQQGDPNETDQFASYTLDFQQDPMPALRERLQPTWDRLSQWELFYAEQFAYLLQQLEAFGLMADTAVLWGSELDDGQHTHFNMPFVLASGANLPFARGSVVRYPLSYSQPDTRNVREPLGDPRSHNDLLRTVLSGLGVDVAAVGAPQHNQDLLTKMLA